MGSSESATPEDQSAAARPVFVVGCQRSGTTALAVMFDRHARFAMLPETQFFNRFVPYDRRRKEPMTHEGLVDRAIADFYIKESQLPREMLLEIFRGYEPSYPNLLRAILECYVHKHNRPRAAEKTCGHLFHLPELFRLYPQAKVICIIRDGRDVVRSLLKARVKWRKTTYLPQVCQRWLMFARAGQQCQRSWPPESFTTVRYEDLILQPERELKRLCNFVGEEFEPNQTESGTGTDVVPEYELEWKGKAKQAPDPTRVAAWRRCGDPMLIARMNHYLGAALRELGYPDTEVEGVSWWRRLAWSIQYLPCRRGIFPIVMRVNHAVRFLRTGSSRRPEPSTVSD